MSAIDDFMSGIDNDFPEEEVSDLGGTFAEDLDVRDGDEQVLINLRDDVPAGLASTMDEDETLVALFSATAMSLIDRTEGNIPLAREMMLDWVQRSFDDMEADE